MYDRKQKTRNETSGSGNFREIERHRQASRPNFGNNDRNLKELLLMKMYNLNSRLVRRATATVALGLLLGAQTAMACTLQNWSSTSGAVDPGSPDADPLNNVVESARYAGLCAMSASGLGFVRDDSPGPGGIDRIRARFYFLADNSSDVTVYEGFNGSTSIFTVEVDGATGEVSLSGDGIGQPPLTATGDLGKWNSIELDWDAGSGQASLWVNTDSELVVADASRAFSSSQVVTSVRLGNLNSASGTMAFDAYESRRSSPVGRLVHPDPNGDGNPNGIDALDFSAMVNDFLEIQRANGTIDCNEDGNIFVDSLDFACIVNAFINQ